MFSFSTLQKLIVLALLLATQVHSHAVLIDPRPRPGSNGPDNRGIKLPSPGDQQFFNTCGNVTNTRGNPVKIVQSGSAMNVTWQLNKFHPSAPGVFISIRCAGQSNFQRLASGLEITLLRTSVTIPLTASGNCELQFRWTTNSDVAGDSASYIACSDIAVLGGRGGYTPGDRDRPLSTPTGPNLQRYSGALYGVMPSQVVSRGREFYEVSNGRVLQRFGTLQAALRESCKTQFEGCRRTPQGNTQVGRANCERQLTLCRATPVPVI